MNAKQIDDTYGIPKSGDVLVSDGNGSKVWADPKARATELPVQAVIQIPISYSIDGTGFLQDGKEVTCVVPSLTKNMNLVSENAAWEIIDKLKARVAELEQQLTTDKSK